MRSEIDLSENGETQPSTDKQVQQRVIEEMGHISSELAHDLRSPLQTIQNAIYLIQRNPENDQLYVMVKQSLQQATAILDNFREYYKGHILQRLQVDPVKVVELSFSDLEIPENIKVVKDYKESEPINIDPAKTALALRKLLQNAVEAMPDGGELSVKVLDEHDWVTIIIADTGSGIPDDLAEIIFTSGSLGRAKGVMLSQKNLASNLYDMLSMLMMYPEDRFLSVLPMHHTYECTCGRMCPLYAGSSVHYSRSLKTVVDDLQNVKATILLGVPLLYDKMFKRISKTINDDKVKSVVVPALRKITNVTEKFGLSGIKKKVFKDILFVYIIAFVFVLFFNSLIIQAFKIHSDSMEPQIIDNTWSKQQTTWAV